MDPVTHSLPQQEVDGYDLNAAVFQADEALVPLVDGIGESLGQRVVVELSGRVRRED